MNSLWDICIFLGLVPKESHYIYIYIQSYGEYCVPKHAFCLIGLLAAVFVTSQHGNVNTTNRDDSAICLKRKWFLRSHSLFKYNCKTYVKTFACSWNTNRPTKSQKTVILIMCISWVWTCIGLLLKVKQKQNGIVSSDEIIITIFIQHLPITSVVMNQREHNVYKIRS